MPSVTESESLAPILGGLPSGSHLCIDTVALCLSLFITELAFSSIADGSQIIYDCKFCDSVADLLLNFGQFW